MTYDAQRNGIGCWQLAIADMRKRWLLRGKDYPHDEAEHVFLDWEVR